MNIVSNHNRLLRGAAIPTAGGDVYNSGWEYTPEGEISGYSGSAIYTGECECDSAAVVDSAFNKSTAWVDEQNYLTAHQDITNLPYVQNSALEFSPQSLISGISGSGFYATSAENAFTADTAYFAYNAEHADSADYVESAHSAQYAQSANSALNAEISNVAYTALTAHYVDEGWEYDENSAITAYNGSAFKSQGGDYSGISPIVVDNDERIISAKSALLGVQDPLYFVEDSETATVIGIHESAISGQGIEYSGIAPIVVDNENHLISAQSAKLGVQGPLYFVEDTPTSTVIGIDDSAFPTFEGTPDGKISAINGSALNADPVIDYSAGNNIDITDHVISVTGSVPSADRADYAVSATSSHFSHSAIEAASANSATYDNLGREITATYLTAHQDVTNLPYVQNTSLESNGILISGISGSGLYATSADNAFEADHAYEADYVLSGWEYDDDDRISAYNGSAFAGQGGGQGVEYDGVAPIVVNNVLHKISAQSAVLGVQSPLYFVEDSVSATVIGISGDLTGQYIPYTNITTGDSGTTVYNVASGIRVTTESGWVEMYNQNKENENEAHLQVGQNYDDGHSFWAELDGAGGGFLQLNWNSGTITSNAHSSYSDESTASISLGNGSLIYHSATHNLTATGGGGDGENKVWQLGSYRLRFWDSAGNTAAVFGPEEYSAWNQMVGSVPSRIVATTGEATGSDILYIVTGS